MEVQTCLNPSTLWLPIITYSLCQNVENMTTYMTTFVIIKDIYNYHSHQS
jgi:hypothetical protein